MKTCENEEKFVELRHLKTRGKRLITSFVTKKRNRIIKSMIDESMSCNLDNYCCRSTIVILGKENFCEKGCLETRRKVEKLPQLTWQLQGRYNDDKYFNNVLFILWCERRFHVWDALLRRVEKCSNAQQALSLIPALHLHFTVDDDETVHILENNWDVCVWDRVEIACFLSCSLKRSKELELKMYVKRIIKCDCRVLHHIFCRKKHCEPNNNKNIQLWRLRYY